MARTGKPEEFRSARLKILFSFLFLLLFFVWLTWYACAVELPSPQKPLVFYSNQTRQDIKRVFSQAISRANQSLFLKIYGLTDSDLLNLLEKKAQTPLPVHVEYDPTASLHLKNLLPSAALHPIKSKGLMHQKILVVDAETAYLGSANFTPASLHHHDNFVIGLHHKELAHFLLAPATNAFTFTSSTQQGQLYLFPDPEKQGYSHLLSAIKRAKKSIHIAMFTLTHEEIAQELIAAQNRGATVKIAIDYFTAKGASKKIIGALHQAGIHIYLSQGRQLLHHKWVWIDHELLGMGSANWTKAAFSKNQDFLLFLSPLHKDQNKFMHSLWEIIETECNPML